jgi:hypothetical protein
LEEWVGMPLIYPGISVLGSEFILAKSGNTVVFVYYKHIRFQIVIMGETRNLLKKRGETEKPYE